MSRKFVAACLAMSLASSSLAYADSGNNTAALAPGKPANVKEAQGEHNTLLWVVGLGVVVGGAILIASGTGNSNVAATTTGSP